MREGANERIIITLLLRGRSKRRALDAESGRAYLLALATLYGEQIITIFYLSAGKQTAHGMIAGCL